MSNTAHFGDEYILQSGRAGHRRLRVISEIHDPYARELLQRAGLSPGKKYAEFGCGLGYVTRWAAGVTGQATGIDLSTDQVEAATELAKAEGLANVDFRAASIYDHDFAPESLDITYSRWLLVHLRHPVEAMRNLFQTLKPGGAMVCEETDITQVYAEPASAAYQRIVDLAMARGHRHGVDYAGGRRLHQWAREAGFDIEFVSAYQPHYLNGQHKGFWSWTLLEAADAIVEEGLLTSAELAELAAGMRAADADPNTLVAHCRTHQLIARKPG